MTRHVAFALALALVGLCAACKSEGEPAGGGGAASESQPAPEQPQEAPAAPAEDDGAAALLGALEAAGFVLAPDVPFDDQGALPEPIANATAAGMTSSRAWVLRRTADEAYVQVFVASFESADAARSAAGTDATLQRDRHVIYVLTFDEAPELLDAVSAALAAK